MQSIGRSQVDHSRQKLKRPVKFRIPFGIDRYFWSYHHVNLTPVKGSHSAGAKSMPKNEVPHPFCETSTIGLPACVFHISPKWQASDLQFIYKKDPSFALRANE